jgi:hypothetical protein
VKQDQLDLLVQLVELDAPDQQDQRVKPEILVELEEQVEPDALVIKELWDQQVQENEVLLVILVKLV